ncbi:hypothetical protein CVT24_013257, partial [Panaeolus cyanescens]
MIQARVSIAEIRQKSISELRWVRRRSEQNNEEVLVFNRGADDDEEEEEEERGVALEGELGFADMPPLMEVSDDEDDEDDDEENWFGNDDRWDEEEEEEDQEEDQEEEEEDQEEEEEDHDGGTAEQEQPTVNSNEPASEHDVLAADAYFRELYERDAARAATLDDYDLFVSRLYTYKVEGHLTEKLYKQLPKVFPNAPTPSLKLAKKHVEQLSGFKS